MHKDTFELVWRRVHDLKEFFPTNGYYARLWVTILDCTPDIQAVVHVVEQDILSRQQGMLKDAIDASYVRECQQYIELHREFLALVNEIDAKLQSRNRKQEAA